MEGTVGGSRTAARASLFLTRVLAPDTGRGQPTQQHGPRRLAAAAFQLRQIGESRPLLRV